MKLLIVDDEPLIHVSIEFCLRQLGETQLQVLHAYNGSEMLACMEENRSIDIALVDIRMPGTDGLAAIASARPQWPHTHYYIMSSFSEFEYAREAIRLSVTEYLLKPLAPEDLARVLSQVREKQAGQEKQVRDSFRSWLESALHHRDVSYLYASGYHTAIVLLTCDSNQEDVLFWVPPFVTAHHSRILSLPCHEGTLLLIYAGEPGLIHEILGSIPKKGYPAGISVFVSSVCHDPAKMSAQLHQILDLSPCRIFTGIGIRYDLAAMGEPALHTLDTARQWLALRDSYFEQQYTAYVSLCARLLPSLDKEIPLQQLVHLSAFIQAMTGSPSSVPAEPRSLKQALLDAEKELLGQRKNTDKMDAVLAYIDQNFTRNISIADLSAQFDLTPNYLSTLLKKRLGIKFTDYLTGLRIARAKKLLLDTNRSVKEITEQVGYYSQSHFTKIFTDKEGCTPADFREHRGNIPPKF